MTYNKPQVLNVKKASTSIMGAKAPINQDSDRPHSSTVAYRNDE